jgi:glutaredoxin-related protein
VRDKRGAHPFVRGRGKKMPRLLLAESRVHPGARAKIESNHRDIVEEVEAAIGQNAVVVVGMAQNPFPKKARAALNKKGTKFKYLEYGSYLSTWRRRTALKMWTGWPTFPMIFVKGTLIGGYTELQALIDNGELDKLLAS